MKRLRDYSLDQFTAMVDMFKATYSDGVEEVSNEIVIEAQKTERDEFILIFHVPRMIKRGKFGHGPDDTEDEYTTLTSQFIIEDCSVMGLKHNLDMIFMQVCEMWRECKEIESNL